MVGNLAETMDGSPIWVSPTADWGVFLGKAKNGDWGDEHFDGRTQDGTGPDTGGRKRGTVWISWPKGGALSWGGGSPWLGAQAGPPAVSRENPHPPEGGDKRGGPTATPSRETHGCGL